MPLPLAFGSKINFALRRCNSLAAFFFVWYAKLATGLLGIQKSPRSGVSLGVLAYAQSAMDSLGYRGFLMGREV